MTETKEPIQEEDNFLTKNLFLDDFIVNASMLDDLIKSLIILRSNIPQFDLNDTTSFDAWRTDLKKKLIDAGVTIEGLSKLTPQGKIVSFEPDGYIEFSTESEKPLTPALLQELSYSLLFQWILSDEPAPHKDELLKKFQQVQNLSPSPTSELANKKFVTSINNAMISDIMQMTKNSMVKYDKSNIAVFVTKRGSKLTATDFNKVLGGLSVSSNKLLNHAIYYLLQTNYYKGHPRSVIPSVEMPLEEYAMLTNADIFPRAMPTAEEQEKENRRTAANLKKLKNDIKRDFEDIASLEWTGEEKGNGPNAGDYCNLRLISSHRIIKGVIRVNFDIDAANYFLHSYLFQLPTALYRFDNRKPNAYAIGYKIAVHNSNDNNFAIGTNSTLSVAKLIDAAPEIPSIEKLQSTGQRNWKRKIKGTLENALNENVSMGFLSKWEYRDPATNKVYTPDQANTLTFLKWYSLMVDFVVIDPPDQAERRAMRTAKAEANRLAAEAKSSVPVKKKRGRPRKNPENA